MTTGYEVAKGVLSEITPALKSGVQKLIAYGAQHKATRRYAKLELQFRSKFLEKGEQFIELISRS